MFSMSEKVESAGSLKYTRPARSQTYILPLLSKVTPTAPFQGPPDGPAMGVSVKPGGTVAAERHRAPNRITRLSTSRRESAAEGGRNGVLKNIAAISEANR